MNEKVDFPEMLGPLDVIMVIDRRTGEEYIAHGKEEAGEFVKHGIPQTNPPLKLTVYTYSIGEDEDFDTIMRLVVEAEARWDRAHLEH
jgi:hypothetical protein